ncbi:uncharacterized protein LOC113373133 isoform X2 [Ctenocephalides felis]|uniref:uncharacterized protein LOC113373133 isoform X2 n=1 Tax=Ctenocephalides felis TaxID=7515 RepID=UPI000E6E1D3F|nr:uncharacterized protein LOC113373133 isoform X2 [Ctenocephalides felis]
MKGLKVELCPSTFEENLIPTNFKGIEDFVQATAHGKAQEVFQRLSEQNTPPDVVIGADTMVTLDGMLFGKPNSEEDSYNTLSRLSGRVCTVYTGVVIKTQRKTVKFCDNTKVHFGKLTPAVIRAYIASGEPMDKAGSFGVQGRGASLIEKMDGDYFTVVGLPLHKLCVELNSLCENNLI